MTIYFQRPHELHGRPYKKGKPNQEDNRNDECENSTDIVDKLFYNWNYLNRLAQICGNNNAGNHRNNNINNHNNRNNFRMNFYFF